jgi:hypothetical protein
MKSLRIEEKRRDHFADWMCSGNEEGSLWLNETYGKALLTYLGKIYNKNTRMYRFFLQLGKGRHELFDDLDILHKLIDKIQQKLSLYRCGDTEKRKFDFLI